MDGYAHVFQYPYGRLKDEGFPLKGKWNAEFFGNNNPIVLELGCGKGEYTVGLGGLFPDKNFIGVDIKGARMWSGAKEALEKEMGNIAFLRTNIELIDRFFAPGEVAEIWLTFPDPQMKKATKRLTSTRFLQLYRTILAAAGLIHLKTDSPFLYTYTDELVRVNAFPVNVNVADLYNSGRTDEILSIKTFYEQQWIGRGFSIKYLQFVCQERKQYIEPEIEIEPDSYRSFGRNRGEQPSQKKRV